MSSPMRASHNQSRTSSRLEKNTTPGNPTPPPELRSMTKGGNFDFQNFRPSPKIETLIGKAPNLPREATRQAQQPQGRVLSEKLVEREVRVPKRVVKEDYIERTIIIPEVIVREELVEEVQKVQSKVVEVEKPVIKERRVEVPEIEYIERIVEKPTKVLHPKIVEIPKIEQRERLVEIPKVVVEEKLVEVEQLTYRDREYDTYIEVPEVRETVLTREVKVPCYVEKPVPDFVDVEVENDIDRTIPVPVLCEARVELGMPQLKPKIKTVQVPIYAPRFIEMPVPRELLEPDVCRQAEELHARVAEISNQPAPSLCEVEGLAATLKSLDFQSKIENLDWESGALRLFKGKGKDAVFSPSVVSLPRANSGSKACIGA